MSDRGYTSIDASFISLPWLWADWDRVVRLMELVRSNFHRIIPDVPDGCEVDLVAGGHAHNPGVMPLLCLFTPALMIECLPDQFLMIERISDWCAALSEDQIQSIVSATDAPTWEELQRIRVYPSRPTSSG